MSATTMTVREQERVVRRGIGRTGKVAVSWSVAGGIALGGFLVAGMTLAGRLSGNALLLTSSGLFLIGALLGFVHGAVLGFLGRPADETRKQALAGLGLAVLYDIPALLVGLIVSGWIAMSVVAAYIGRIAPTIGVAVAWLIGAVLVLVAAVQGAKALRGAYARWPEAQARLGTVLVAGLFAALLVLFLADRPVIWGLEMRVTEVGAVLLAAAATLWLAGPMVTLALMAIDRIPGLKPVVQGSGWANIALGLAVGIGLGLLALPFYGATYHLPIMAGMGTVGGVLHGVSEALVNEVLLRLFMVSGLVWLMLRRLDVHQGRAAVAAVTLAAVVQVILYTPSALALGLPSTLATVTFMAATVAVPAVAFGILFWKRGFGTALLADVAAVVALVLFV